MKFKAFFIFSINQAYLEVFIVRQECNFIDNVKEKRNVVLLNSMFL